MNATNSSNATFAFNPVTTSPGYIVFFAAVIALGVPGNMLVIAVYGHRRQRGKTSASWIFIFLACLDLLACVIKPSFVLSMEMGVWKYTGSDAFCRMNHFSGTLVTIASILLLSLMAADRYRRVCQPLAVALSPSLMLKINVVMVTVASFLAIPPLVMYYNDELGHCRLDPEFRFKMYPRIYYMLVFSMYAVTSVCMILLYIKVCIKVWTHVRVGVTTGFRPTGSSITRPPFNGFSTSRTGPRVKGPSAVHPSLNSNRSSSRLNESRSSSDGSADPKPTSASKILIPREARVAVCSSDPPTEILAESVTLSCDKRVKADSPFLGKIMEKSASVKSELNHSKAWSSGSDANRKTSCNNQDAIESPAAVSNPDRQVHASSHSASQIAKSTDLTAACNIMVTKSQPEIPSNNSDSIFVVGFRGTNSTMTEALERTPVNLVNVGDENSKLGARPGSSCTLVPSRCPKNNHWPSLDETKLTTLSVGLEVGRLEERDRPMSKPSHSATFRASIQRQSDVRHADDVRMTLQLVVITLIFILTWVPAWLMLFTIKESRDHPSSYYSSQIFLLGHTSNAIVYAVFSKVFRQNVVHLFKDCKCIRTRARPIGYANQLPEGF